MISMHQHSEKILTQARAVVAHRQQRESGGAEWLSLAQALGRVLDEDVTTAVDVPPFDNSAMDGFAVRATDAVEGARLDVIDDVPAGSRSHPALGPGQTVRIMTGAAMPETADAVIPVEHVVAGPAHATLPQDSRTAPLPAWIEVEQSPKPAAHIRRAGEDHEAGSRVLERGAALGPWQLAAAASAGRNELQVTFRPRVAVVSTGSELVEPGQPLQRGQIPESNSFLLAASICQAGCDLAGGQPLHFDDDARDQLAEYMGRVAAGEEPVDAIVFSGGVSVGAYDVVKEVLAPRGVEFSKVAVQPGKPQGFGTLGHTLVFGLPGNPVSVATSFEVFVRPALRILAGAQEIQRPVVIASAEVDWRTPSGRAQIMPVNVDLSAKTRPTMRPASHGGSGSHFVSALAQAEHLAIIPADVDQVRPGDSFPVMMLS